MIPSLLSQIPQVIAPTIAGALPHAAASQPLPATPAPPAAAPIVPDASFLSFHQSPLAAHAPWLTHAFAGIFILAALLLIVLLAVQTTKNEGLGGTIGGRVESAYRPRLGFDQQLQRLTTFVAIVFVFFGTIVAISGI